MIHLIPSCFRFLVSLYLNSMWKMRSTTTRVSTRGAFLLAILLVSLVAAFSGVGAFTVIHPISINPSIRTAHSSHENKSIDDKDEILLKNFVEEEYPAFYSLLSVNAGIWQTMAEAENGCTLFAPSNAVFDSLGEKRMNQLRDIRNEETARKIGLYHVILTEAVSAARLRTEDWTVKAPKGEPRPITVQAVVTMGGQVPVGRSKSGGLLGWGAKEDGDIVIGPEARIIKSYKVAGSYVHEVDNLISPVILWRYFDQLRIPGF